MISNLSREQSERIDMVQDYVRRLENELGFDSQGVIEKCLLLGEEVGELFKAVRVQEGLPADNRMSPVDIKHELADILIYLCTIANRYDISLSKALLSKHAINTDRHWSSVSRNDTGQPEKLGLDRALND